MGEKYLHTREDVIALIEEREEVISISEVLEMLKASVRSDRDDHFIQAAQ